MVCIPRDTRLDSTLSFRADPYRFVSARCRELGTDAFETRLMLRRAVCRMGEEAAHVCYHPGRFTRRGALPADLLDDALGLGARVLEVSGSPEHRVRQVLSHAQNLETH